MSGAPPVGRRWPPHRYEVGREKIREYAAAIGAGSEVHREHGAARELGYPAVVAPPTFAAVYVAPAVSQVMFDPAVGIFDPAVGLAGYRFVQRVQEFAWGEPVCAGTTIETVASLEEAGERDGTVYRVFASESVDGEGRVVCRGRYEGVVPGPRRAKRAKPPEPERGEPAVELRLIPDRYAPARYAGASGDFTPFHLDAELARALGLPGVILHGLYTYALLARALVESRGGDPRALARLRGRFRRPAVPEQELIAEAWATGEPGELEGRVLQGDRPVLDEASARLREK